MKILLVHNFYKSSSPSGEDIVFENEKRLLQENGIDVHLYCKHNDDIVEDDLPRLLLAGIQTVWSIKSYHEIEKKIKKIRPDVVHFHNTFPLISPSVYWACFRERVPTVQTLHNYRFLCLGALLQRDNSPCEMCIGRLPWKGIRHRCYRKSLVASSAIFSMLFFHRMMGTFNKAIDQFICLTAFSAGKFIEGGLPASKIDVKPNFISRPNPNKQKRKGALFVGRLSEEKGVRTLVAAWRNLHGIHLKIIGEGPLKKELQNESRGEGLNVTFAGRFPHRAVMDEIQKAEVVIIPSECYEGLPMAVIEAYAAGTPVIASNLGNLREVVREGYSGLFFTPKDPGDLRRVVKRYFESQERIAEMGKNAKRYYEEHFSKSANFRKMQDIYKNVIKKAQCRKK